MSSSLDADRLTRSVILSAALKVADDHGMEAVTMRRIAAVLDVSSMAAYRYFRTKEEIYEGLAALAWEALDADLDSTLDWSEQLRRFFRHMHKTLFEHPGLVQILIAHPATGLTVYRTAERLAGVLCGAGFTIEEAARVIAMLESYTFGFTVRQRSRAGRNSDLDHRLLHELPAEEFPHLSSASASFASWASEDHFIAGLDWQITNLSRHLQQKSDQSADSAGGSA